MDTVDTPDTPDTITASDNLSIVAMGGGRGTSQVLIGSRPYFARRTAVVGVTDSGRSTGVARAIAEIPAPGDLRNTIATLSDEPDSLLVQILQHRLRSSSIPELEGMAFGNLLIAALTQMQGGFATALETVGMLSNCTDHVLPISTVNTQLCAELEDGSIMEHELAVRGVNKAPISFLFLSQPGALAHPPVLDAIAEADLVVLGPGSFFTSIMANLLFEGVKEALQQTDAVVVFVCNTTTQPGQTDGYRTIDHVQRMVDMLGPGTIDVALINRSESVNSSLLAQYAADGIYLLQPYDDEIQRISDLGVRPLVHDYVEANTCKRDLWNKQDTIRHDTTLLGQTLWKVVRDYAKPTRYT
jgi:uncharacterized cofD-like protein